MEDKALNELLLESFPELAGVFDEYVSWQDGMDTGAFLTYEDLLLPLIRDAIAVDDGDFLRRATEFIERLLLCGDSYAENVANVGLLEGLKATCPDGAVRFFLEDESRRQFDEIRY